MLSMLKIASVRLISLKAAYDKHHFGINYIHFIHITDLQYLETIVAKLSTSPTYLLLLYTEDFVQ